MFPYSEGMSILSSTDGISWGYESVNALLLFNVRINATVHRLIPLGSMLVAAGVYGTIWASKKEVLENHFRRSTPVQTNI